MPLIANRFFMWAVSASRGFLTHSHPRIATTSLTRTPDRHMGVPTGLWSLGSVVGCDACVPANCSHKPPVNFRRPQVNVWMGFTTLIVDKNPHCRTIRTPRTSHISSVLGRGLERSYTELWGYSQRTQFHDDRKSGYMIEQ